jgi:hypothetical protein
MTNQPKETSTPANQPEKKKSDTVQLTAEDLRAISGGQQSNPGGPMVQPTDRVAVPITKTKP